MSASAFGQMLQAGISDALDVASRVEWGQSSNVTELTDKERLILRQDDRSAEGDYRFWVSSPFTFEWVDSDMMTRKVDVPLGLLIHGSIFHLDFANSENAIAHDASYCLALGYDKRVCDDIFELPHRRLHAHLFGGRKWALAQKTGPLFYDDILNIPVLVIDSIKEDSAVEDPEDNSTSDTDVSSPFNV